jgi:tRNA G18 (ribose-2'-O)-methylase SpoU
MLVFGNEADGLDQRLVDSCDLRITVPMPGTADSLNVAVAAGIILYHFRRPD